MYVVSLSYIVPLEEVEPHVPAHMAWLEQSYEAGIFLASGRKVPRTGGVILAQGERAALERCLREDPFAVHNLAAYEITEFVASKTVPGLDALKE
ncbi:YciI family protein [Nitratireductor pacificus]|uniref:YCII-like protein n=1 Tax=Nitratireductor pacificus pht-3B TaxID=391937 RepID=K2M4U2_9HYPH|nr:YciI family protein [Nitratireductor pacificus]EKF17106.1 YCII-like protein [Nitratireductor pacificus pht-3B]